MAIAKQPALVRQTTASLKCEPIACDIYVLPRVPLLHSVARTELASVSDRLSEIWQLRHELGDFVHFRKPLGAWANEHLKSARLRGLFLRILPPESPALFLLLVLAYLGRGWLSRPIGGTPRFRDALIDRYRAAGGETVMNSTVEEILEAGGRARGVRLTDGTILDADIVLSTASAPETVLDCLDRHLPDLKSGVRMTDIATPLTYWRHSRAWRGAFDGWLPGANALKHVPKELPGLDGFYMAGQWVEPGGGVPTALNCVRIDTELVHPKYYLLFPIFSFTQGRNRYI